MMQTRMARRAISDVTAVCRHAAPGTAALWMKSLVTGLPECMRSRSLSPADRPWGRTGARFRTPSGTDIFLPPKFTSGAREMYCRNVYLRTGLTMPTTGWVIDLGANSGLFAVWAAVNGADVVAVEAQKGFAPEISELAIANHVGDRIHVEIAMASGAVVSGASQGIVADDRCWAATSHGAPKRPLDVSLPQVMSRYRIDRVGLLKVDIEGGEFAVFGADEDLQWLDRVDQIALEVHRDFGDPLPVLEQLEYYGFRLDLRDNDGRRVDAASNLLDYAYCHRP